jgi:hypothetical protein
MFICKGKRTQANFTISLRLETKEIVLIAKF